MTKNFRITVDGRPYTVSVDDIEATDAPPAAAPAAAHAAPAPAPPPPKQAAVPAAPAPTPAGPGTITTPIGGMVRSIEVEVGSMVKIGDTVAIIEVMKMKTEIKSTMAGKVAAISARVNQSVETGEAIMTLAA
jgi:biotin carboxyl carrier protein